MLFLSKEVVIDFLSINLIFVQHKRLVYKTQKYCLKLNMGTNVCFVTSACITYFVFRIPFEIYSVFENYCELFLKIFVNWMNTTKMKIIAKEKGKCRLKWLDERLMNLTTIPYNKSNIFLLYKFTIYSSFPL